MTVDKMKQDSALTLAVEGRLDTATAPQLEEILASSLDGVTALTIDFRELKYISSAGLRVLLQAQKKMNTAGTMKVTNVSDDIMEVFEITGFDSILTIE